MAQIHFEDLYRIETTRLVGWDYSTPGWYFITICCQDKKHYFDNDAVKKIAEECWQEIPKHFLVAYLGQSAVMPNHLHGVVCIDPQRRAAETSTSYKTYVETPHVASLPGFDVVGGGLPMTIKHSTKDETKLFYELISKKSHQRIPNIVQAFKAAVTTKCQKANLEIKWQPSFYDSIIRSEKALFYIEEYIRTNPENWNHDPNNESFLKV